MNLKSLEVQPPFLKTCSACLQRLKVSNHPKGTPHVFKEMVVDPQGCVTKSSKRLIWNTWKLLLRNLDVLRWHWNPIIYSSFIHSSWLALGFLNPTNQYCNVHQPIHPDVQNPKPIHLEATFTTLWQILPSWQLSDPTTEVYNFRRNLK